MNEKITTKDGASISSTKKPDRLGLLRESRRILLKKARKMIKRLLRCYLRRIY